MAKKQTRKMIQVGTGGFGAYWCQNFLPPNIKDGTIEVVAAVDISPEALNNARKHLGLRDDQLYTDIKKAFDAKKADFCTAVLPLENGEHQYRIKCTTETFERVATENQLSRRG